MESYQYGSDKHFKKALPMARVDKEETTQTLQEYVPVIGETFPTLAPSVT